MKNINTLTISSLLTLILTSSASAFGLHSLDIDSEIQYNDKRIKEYQKAVKQLQKKNQYLKSEKAKNPQLYIKKPLYEVKKDKYIYRIKLNGAKTEALNFVIKNDMVSISMNIKNEQKDSQSYFFSSRYFSSSYQIPKDVNQEKIKHHIDGDYFVIEMPKKP